MVRLFSAAVYKTKVVVCRIGLGLGVAYGLLLMCCCLWVVRSGFSVRIMTVHVF